jgi:hypothetical protein
MPLKSKYDKDGHCIETQVGLIICSPTEDGRSPDPSTAREYRLIFPCCGGFTIEEVPELEEVRCKGCKKTVGVINQWEWQ